MTYKDDLIPLGFARYYLMIRKGMKITWNPETKIAELKYFDKNGIILYSKVLNLEQIKKIVESGME